MPKTITEAEFLKDPKKYLDYTSGDQQITILNDKGENWIILGRGPQSEITPEETKALEERFDQIKYGPDLSDRSWFD